MKPCPTGSAAAANTIGTVLVAFCSAATLGDPCVTITAGLEFRISAMSAGSRSSHVIQVCRSADAVRALTGYPGALASRAGASWMSQYVEKAEHEIHPTARRLRLSGLLR